MNSNLRTAIIWAVLCCLAVLLFVVVKSNSAHPVQELSFTRFLEQAAGDKVKTVTITGNDVTGQFKDDHTELHTTVPVNYPKLYDLLDEHNVDVKVKEPNNGNWTSLLINAIPSSW